MISENSLEDIRRWFYLDQWTVQQALMLFCGADPDGPSGPYPPMRPINCFEDQFDPSDAYDKYNEYQKRWRSGDHTVESYRPGYFLDWAKTHGVTVPWAGIVAPDLFAGIGLSEANTPEVASRQRGSAKAVEANNDSAEPTRKEKSLLRTIAALLEYIRGNITDVEKHPSFVNDTKLIELLDGYYKGYEGLSASTLSRRFPEARKILEQP